MLHHLVYVANSHSELTMLGIYILYLQGLSYDNNYTKSNSTSSNLKKQLYIYLVIQYLLLVDLLNLDLSV